MDPRDALNRTIEVFDLKAVTISAGSGIDERALSKYRRKHKDMNSLNLCRIIAALPEEARFFFAALLVSKDKSVA